MFTFLSWYVSISLLGWLTFPLAYRLFPGLLDRGYSLTRALGLLLWSYVFWILASLGIVQNDSGGLTLALLVVLALSLWALGAMPARALREAEEASTFGLPSSLVRGFSVLIEWLKARARLIVSVELLFFLAFAFMAFVRASDPYLVGTEKPMELAFISAILRSPTFPPRDPWLSGYAISYYYFGYVMAAMLAKVSGVTGAVAHNMMTALVFALSAIGAYGLGYTLLGVYWRGPEGGGVGERIWLRFAFLMPLFLLLVSNLEGFLEVLHHRGVFWRLAPDGRPSSFFWAWLDLKELSEPPSLSAGWVSQRHLWWWRASRVVMDYDLAGRFQEVIDEFPAFSFVLADLHPHVLAMPFALLAIGLALHLFLGGWKGRMSLAGWQLPLAPEGFLCLALTLGGLSFLNTWDILPYTALALGALVLQRVGEDGWKWRRLEEAVTLGIPLLLTAILLYLPFYLGFSSQLGGLLPNLVNPTRGAHLWIMFAPLLLPLFAYFLHVWRREKVLARWLEALALAFGLIVLLWGLSWLLGWVIAGLKPDLAQAFLQQQGVATFAELFRQAGLRRLEALGGWVTLAFFLFMIFALLLPPRRGMTGRQVEAGERLADSLEEGEGARVGLPASPGAFILLLALVGSLLVTGVEFLYLRDVFGNRMNTVFKFYFQAWILWSVAAAFSVAVLWRAWRGFGGYLRRAAIVVLVLVSLLYPALAFPTKTANFRWRSWREALATARSSGDWRPLRYTWTLDGEIHLEWSEPDVAAMIRWLRTAPDGILVEAVGGSYDDAAARLSAYTGLPTVLGWVGHEEQWRGDTFLDKDQRYYDVRTLYESASWEEILAILRKYGIRYVCIGPTERERYKVNERKFQRMLTPVFQQGSAVIYEVP